VPFVDSQFPVRFVGPRCGCGSPALRGPTGDLSRLRARSTCPASPSSSRRISSQQERAAVGRSISPLPWPHRSPNAPRVTRKAPTRFTWSPSRAFHRHNGFVRARAQKWTAARASSLPVPLSPELAPYGRGDYTFSISRDTRAPFCADNPSGVQPGKRAAPARAHRFFSTLSPPLAHLFAPRAQFCYSERCSDYLHRSHARGLHRGFYGSVSRQHHHAMSLKKPRGRFSIIPTPVPVSRKSVSKIPPEKLQNLQRFPSAVPHVEDFHAAFFGMERTRRAHVLVIHYQECTGGNLRRTLLFANRENSGGPFELRANRSACVRIPPSCLISGTACGLILCTVVKAKGWANPRS